MRTQQWLDYDAFGQAWRFLDERSNPTDLIYQWGPMKNLRKVTTYRQRDNLTTELQPTDFLSDGLGRRVWTMFPDGSSELTAYNALGLVEAFKTRKNQTKRIYYDARGREDYHTWDGDAAPGIDRTWDDANRLTGISNIFSAIDYKYDDGGQVWWEGNTIAGTARVQTNYYRYPSGDVAHVQYPYGFMIRKDYTARGQLQTVGWDDGNGNWLYRATDYYYHADGKVNYQTYGGGTTRSDFGYDGRGMISSVRHYKPGTNQNLAERSYGRDNRDRIVWWKRGTDASLNGKETGIGDQFIYDAEGQLTDAWYQAQIDGLGNASNAIAQDHFQYDQLGNRFGQNQTVSHGTVSFNRRDNGLNQYSSWSPSVIYHDDNYPGRGPAGNGVVMAEGWVTASYNALNQPVAIWSAAYAGTSNFMWFGYDPLGRCVKRWVGASGNQFWNPATYFYYDGWNLVQEGPSGTGPTRVYGHGARVDEIVASSTQATGQIAFHHYDAQGNCILLSDSGTGNIIEQYDYEAFGRPYYYNGAGSWTPASAWNNRFLFTGREWLTDLGLYDYRNRMYQPDLGRFLQPDPKQFAAGDYNLYRYCHNDPVNRNDPFGLDYLDVEYTSQSQPVSAPGQRDVSGHVHSGVMTWRTDDGKAVSSYNINSGGYKTADSKVAGAETPTFPGKYSVDNLRDDRGGLMRYDGKGFSFDVNPKFKQEKGKEQTLIRIHGDGGEKGTHGCIGVREPGPVLRDFVNKMKDYLRNNKDIELRVRDKK